MTLLDDLLVVQAPRRRCGVAEFIKTLEPGLGEQLLDIIDNHPEISRPTLIKSFPGLTRDILGTHRNRQCHCWKN